MRSFIIIIVLCLAVLGAGHYESDHFYVEAPSTMAQEVKIGSSYVDFERIVCATKEVSPQVRRRIYKLIDGEWELRSDLGNAFYTVTPTDWGGLACSPNPIGLSFPLPSNLTPGIYMYKPEAFYEINLVKRVRKDMPPINFTLVE